MPIILTNQMVEEATDVARALHDAFTGILQLPAISGRRASTLSVELNVGRMTCQRIVKLGKSDAPTPGPELLTQLPGINGLRQFLEALAQNGTSRKLLGDAIAAVDGFDLFLRSINLSQTSFAAAFSSTNKPRTRNGNSSVGRICTRLLRLSLDNRLMPP